MPEDTNTPKKPNESDILLVYNSDINCDVIDSEDNYPHKDYFQVKWSNHPHRVAPGKVRKMPRFLAEHFAKHLADHILTKMEEQTGRKGLVQSPTERPRVLKEILLGVDTYFLGEEDVDQGEKIVKAVETLNEERPLDLGEVPNPMLGVLKPEPKTVNVTDSVSESPSAVDDATVTNPKDVATAQTAPVQEVEPAPTSQEKVSIWDDTKPKPSRKSLIADCEKLGIEVSGKESVDQLIALIKKF